MKNKTTKRVALLTAMAMTAGLCLTGCGKEEAPASAPAEESKAPASTEAATTEEAAASTEAKEELEPAEISWLLRIPEQEDGDKVLEKVNELIKDDLNATLDIQFFDPVAYPEKTKLKIASGEEFDIMFTSAGYGYFDYASKGAYVPLDDLLPKYAPETYKMIPEGFWDATRVDGKIYGVPNYQIAARQTTMTIRKDIVEKYDIDMSAIKTMEDLEPILAMLKENEPDKKFIMGAPSLNYFDTMNYLGLEGIGADGTPGCIEIDGTELKVVNQYEHPSFVQLCQTLKKYEEAGYINKDLALVDDLTELQKNGEILVSPLGNYKPGCEAEFLARYGYESVNAIITEPYVNTTSILGTMQAISRTSEDPERALMFIEKVNTDPELYNTIVYGLEGEHYTKTGDKNIEVKEDSKYKTNVPWMIGNTFNGYLLPGNTEEVYTETKELNENAKVSRIMGFNFNPEPVKAEISQCQTIVDKYCLKGLEYGMFDDVDATLAKMNEELRAAGMDKVIAEKQAQLDAWAAANNK